MAFKTVAALLSIGGLAVAFVSLFIAARGNWDQAYLFMSAAYSMRCAAGIIDD